jgi:hypothetical protein
MLNQRYKKIKFPYDYVKKLATVNPRRSRRGLTRRLQINSLAVPKPTDNLKVKALPTTYLTVCTLASAR